MIFILDNYDSFTYNLYQYFGELGEQVIVRRSDQCSLPEIRSLNPELIVISPGPCTPNEAKLALEVIEVFQGEIPILGVCLGHQAIGQVFGGQVVRAKVPTHGKTSLVKHDGQGVFQYLPNPLEVTRYHSLIIDRTNLPDILQITAETDDGEIMGIRHRYLPIEGIQFHPEAILTEGGHILLRNAVETARNWRQGIHSDLWQVKAFKSELPPYLLFEALHDSPQPFFLDSGHNYEELGKYSFLGAFPFLQITAYADKIEVLWPEESRRDVYPIDEQGTLGQLDKFYEKYRVPVRAPFPFAGGAVGFFSYDLKDELEKLQPLSENDLDLPLWRLAWYDGIIVYDHKRKSYYLTACGMNEEGLCVISKAEDRLQRLENILNNYQAHNQHDPDSQSFSAFQQTVHPALPILPEVSKEQYLSDLKRVIEYIYAGDIYQANLTQRFSMSWQGDPWQLYQQLHKTNPAPFAAFLPYPDFQILCSSPERFIRIDSNGLIETRPIKGTRPRGSTPENDQNMADELISSLKDRAELTMIIDLERNDLGRICRFGTVRVPDLIRLEKYPTVYHLVSTITGQLKEELTASTILKGVFPGGSITGAPKIRAMEIIDELEPYRRGIYTGSIGYLGFDGAWDLNIVIRTILLKNGRAYLHAGGGIVADSVPEHEYQETLHKAKALFTVLEGELQDDRSNIGI